LLFSYYYYHGVPGKKYRPSSDARNGGIKLVVTKLPFYASMFQHLFALFFLGMIFKHAKGRQSSSLPPHHSISTKILSQLIRYFGDVGL